MELKNSDLLRKIESSMKMVALFCFWRLPPLKKIFKNIASTLKVMTSLWVSFAQTSTINRKKNYDELVFYDFNPLMPGGNKKVTHILNFV